MNDDELKGCKMAVEFISRSLSQEDLKNTKIVLKEAMENEYEKMIEKLVSDEIERRQKIINNLVKSIKEFFEGVENGKQQ